ncbi:MAG TPA: MXAN_5187 family protein [Polyangiaceae bacterium]|jgi:hypothetical protein|nr:MXAN_5187 family protein [Polyangiaceae bacterium]
MLLSRFWYVLLSLVIGSLVFMLYIAQSMHNRVGAKVIGEGLSSDSQVVSWYMRTVARERSSQLIQFSLNPDVVGALSKASADPEKIAKETRDKATDGLTKLIKKVPEDYSFDAVFAVDRHGRVVGQVGYEQARTLPEFELGGYPVVADALHGNIRDDTFVWDRIYMVVARPVEYQAGEMPIGAIVGFRIVDDRFARDIAARTGAAVAFYSGGERIASGSPDSFDRSQLDGIITDLKLLPDDPDYKEKGRSSVRYLSPTVGVVYARMSGEAWQRGAGYVVGRAAASLKSPLAFFSMADDKDKGSANLLVIGLAMLVAMGLGLLFSFIEHTRPLIRFKLALEELAKGTADQLQASKVTGVYRKLVTQINDGIDHAVAKGGGSRRAADLQQVLGDIPDQPAMSAFSFPEPAAAAASPETRREAPLPKVPEPRAKPSLPKAPQRFAETMPEAGSVAPVPAAEAPKPAEAQSSDPQGEWQAVFQEFLRVKGECGESTTSLTYEKFEGTLKRNRDAIVNKHGVGRVKFTVYVKDGKAALKASPVKE